MRFLAVLALILLPSFAMAANFPALTGRVVDDANVLSPQAEQSLTQMLAAHEQQTTNQVVVVTVPSLGKQQIEEYGYQLGRHWGIGQKGKNNGVLFIIAPNDRQTRIEVGYGLEGTLTDALSSQIIYNIVLPEFKQGQMEKGIVDGTTAIVSVLGGKQVNFPAQASANPGYQPSDWLIIVFIIIIIIIRIRFGFIYGWGSGSGFSGGGGSSFSGGGGGSFGGGGSSGRW